MFRGAGPLNTCAHKQCRPWQAQLHLGALCNSHTSHLSFLLRFPYSKEENLSILVFLCCITNYHKLSGFKQHKQHLTVSVGHESRHSSAGSCLWVCNKEDGQGCGPIWSLMSASRFIELVGQIQFLAAVELVVTFIFFEARRKASAVALIIPTSVSDSNVRFKGLIKRISLLINTKLTG